MSVSLPRKSPQPSRRLIAGLRRDSKASSNGSVSSILSPTRVGSLAHSGVPSAGSDASMQALLDQEEAQRMQRRRQSKNPLIIALMSELDAQQLKLKEKRERLVQLQNAEEDLKNKMAAVGLAERRQSLRLSRRSTDSSFAAAKKMISNGHLNDSVIDSDSEGESASFAADRSQSIPSNVSHASTPRSVSVSGLIRTPASQERAAQPATLLKRRKRPVQLQRRTPGESLGLSLRTITLPMKNPDTGENTGEFYDPTFVCSVTPGGIAARAGLQEGDQLLEIDGEKCAMAKHNHVVDLIKRNQGTITMLVRFTNDFRRAELHKALITSEVALAQKQSRLEQLNQAIRDLQQDPNAASTSAAVAALTGNPLPAAAAAAAVTSPVAVAPAAAAASAATPAPAATVTPVTPSTPAASASRGPVTPLPPAKAPGAASTLAVPAPDSVRSESPDMASDIDLCKADLTKTQGPWGNNLQMLISLMQSQWIDERVEYEQDRDRAEIQIRAVKEDLRRMENTYRQTDALVTKLQMQLHDKTATQARLELEISKLKAEVARLSSPQSGASTSTPSQGSGAVSGSGSSSNSARRSSASRLLPPAPNKMLASSPPTSQAPPPPVETSSTSSAQRGVALLDFDSEEEEFV